MADFGSASASLGEAARDLTDDVAGGAPSLDAIDVELIAIGATVAAVVAREERVESGEDELSASPIPLAPIDSSTALARLAEHAGLDEAATTLLRVLVAGELDRRVGLLLRRLATDPTRAGTEVASAVTVLEAAGFSSRAALWALDSSSPLVAYGLVTLRGEGPLLWRRVAVAPRALGWVLGEFALPGSSVPLELPLVVEAPLPIDALWVPPAVMARLQAALPGVDEGAPLWLTGLTGSGRRTLLAAMFMETQRRRLLTVSAHVLLRQRLPELLPLLRRELLLCGATLCVCDADEEPAERERPGDLPALVEFLRRARVPTVYTSREPPDWNRFEQPPTVVELPVPDVPARLSLWQELLPDCDGLDVVASRFRLPPGRLVRAAESARRQAEIERRAVIASDAARAVTGQVAQRVSLLGTRIEDRQTWEDVVLPNETLDAIREIVSRARHRHKVLEQWGFQRKLAKGVGLAALFAGPPGTGKTMVAGLIARELGLDLYQIDLSRIVSKYIGETEKNLAQVFDAAEGANVMLLFDEADSLFSKRTEVKSSVDRYSNLEVNYLLQRLERFEGVSILTTNLEGSIDPAFKRRLAFRVLFPLPEAQERVRLWQRMLPAEAEVAGPLDFSKLAGKYEFSGGNIRNAMLRAAYLAAAEDVPISLAHIERAVLLEYRDTGKLVAGGRLG